MLQITPNLAVAHINRDYARIAYAKMIDDDHLSKMLTLHAPDSFLAVGANNAICDFDNKHLQLNTAMQWVQRLDSDIDIKLMRSNQNLDIGPKNQQKRRRHVATGVLITVISFANKLS